MSRRPAPLPQQQQPPQQPVVMVAEEVQYDEPSVAASARVSSIDRKNPPRLDSRGYQMPIPAPPDEGGDVYGALDAGPPVRPPPRANPPPRQGYTGQPLTRPAVPTATDDEFYGAKTAVVEDGDDFYGARARGPAPGPGEQADDFYGAVDNLKITEQVGDMYGKQPQPQHEYQYSERDTTPSEYANWDEVQVKPKGPQVPNRLPQAVEMAGPASEHEAIYGNADMEEAPLVVGGEDMYMNHDAVAAAAASGQVAKPLPQAKVAKAKRFIPADQGLGFGVVLDNKNDIPNGHYGFN